MRIYDLIAKKRDGGTHSREELESIVNGYVSGEVADYQMAAWMMAVYRSFTPCIRSASAILPEII